MLLYGTFRFKEPAIFNFAQNWPLTGSKKVYLYITGVVMHRTRHSLKKRALYFGLQYFQSNKVDHIYHAKVHVFSFDRNNFKSY